MSYNNFSNFYIIKLEPIFKVLAGKLTELLPERLLQVLRLKQEVKYILLIRCTSLEYETKHFFIKNYI